MISHLHLKIHWSMMLREMHKIDSIGMCNMYSDHNYL